MLRRRVPTRRNRKGSKKLSKTAVDYAVEIIYPICCSAGSTTLVQGAGHGEKTALRSAIEDRDTPAIFDWMIKAVSLQGVSDAAAMTYVETHGSVTWRDVEGRLRVDQICSKLQSYWHYYECGYSKQEQNCSRPEWIESCPVPKPMLRNGRLNQAGMALWLFLRDVAGSDLVEWIDQQLASTATTRVGSGNRQEALVGPLAHVFGLGPKVLFMALADLLLAAPPERKLWREMGARLTAIDTLVHKLLHRTGILNRFAAEHPYGPRCYVENGCAHIIEQVARRIDAREFNPNYPAYFPRFVQHAIWRFCAQAGLNVCNSVRVKDGRRCANTYCRLYPICGREPIRTETP